MLRPHREALCGSIDSLNDSGVDTTVKGVIRSGTDRHGSSPTLPPVTTRRPSSSVLRILARRCYHSVGPGRWLQANTTSRLVVTHGAGELDHVSSILIAVAGGPHSGAAVETARALVVDHDAWIDPLHVVEPDASDERQVQARRYLEESHNLSKDSTDTIRGSRRQTMSWVPSPNGPHIIT